VVAGQRFDREEVFHAGAVSEKTPVVHPPRRIASVFFQPFPQQSDGDLFYHEGTKDLTTFVSSCLRGPFSTGLFGLVHSENSTRIFQALATIAVCPP